MIDHVTLKDKIEMLQQEEPERHWTFGEMREELLQRTWIDAEITVEDLVRSKHGGKLPSPLSTVGLRRIVGRLHWYRHKCAPPDACLALHRDGGASAKRLLWRLFWEQG